MRFGNMGTFCHKLSLSTAPSSPHKPDNRYKWRVDGGWYAVRSTQYTVGGMEMRTVLATIGGCFRAYCLISICMGHTTRLSLSAYCVLRTAYCLLPFLLAKDPRGIPNAVGAAFHVVTVDLVGLADGVPVAGR